MLSKYTKVKHGRAFIDSKNSANYKKANFKNISKSLAGLYILENNYISQIATDIDLLLLEKSSIFSTNKTSVYVEDKTVNIVC